MKYTPDQLCEMAQTALAAKLTGDPRWLQLQLTLAVVCGMDPANVEAQIEALAQPETAHG